jgi:argininosuccinate lyase
MKELVLRWVLVDNIRNYLIILHVLFHRQLVFSCSPFAPHAITLRMTKKAWSGRFDQKESPLMEEFNASLGFDKRLYLQDITGSLAHAAMLKKIGLLSTIEHKKISGGLKQVKKLIDDGKFKFNLADEDIHMAIEAKLTKLIGPVGGKLHTARSRNDQVATDTRLFVREQNLLALQKLIALQKVIVKLAKKNLGTILPGYTHLQRAQPVLLSHHLLAYFEMLVRDFHRFSSNFQRLDQCPLGAGALAGSPIPIDRKNTAKALGFTEPTCNSMDTVSDRDFVLDYLSASSILMMHLSRLSEELIIWSSQEYGFITLPKGFCTGSSIMPQKVNPDAPELIRGKTGRVYGNLMALLTTMKSLPLAYNKDMQEDKEPLFDSADTINMCLDVLIQMLPGAKFNACKMQHATKEGFLLATDVADYLASKGIPFRKAHEVVGNLVQHCEVNNTYLEDLDLKTLKKFSSTFEKDVFKVLSIENSVNSRKSFGGTAISCVKKEIARAEKLLG